VLQRRAQYRGATVKSDEVFTSKRDQQAKRRLHIIWICDRDEMFAVRSKGATAKKLNIGIEQTLTDARTRQQTTSDEVRSPKEASPMLIYLVQGND